ncbi:hypothetical protein CCM_01670 [Cordyceps militaris CM01]|uniref:Uncharacterized protein n=1 Tax=Cordyceps militaris (strain CM01) TaxID=983644 RepID=G3J6I3_CORMM|nr:uncharacterized protein CCM_01670 [Cordyceps militaris CM01]EGX97011.1 hypothetical protein CCM_01670 [Cordyceps militaris CM01]
MDISFSQDGTESLVQFDVTVVAFGLSFAFSRPPSCTNECLHLAISMRKRVNFIIFVRMWENKPLV